MMCKYMRGGVQNFFTLVVVIFGDCANHGELSIVYDAARLALGPLNRTGIAHRNLG